MTRDKVVSPLTMKLRSGSTRVSGDTRRAGSKTALQVGHAEGVSSARKPRGENRNHDSHSEARAGARSETRAGSSRRSLPAQRQEAQRMDDRTPENRRTQTPDSEDEHQVSKGLEDQFQEATDDEHNDVDPNFHEVLEQPVTTVLMESTPKHRQRALLGTCKEIGFTQFEGEGTLLVYISKPLRAQFGQSTEFRKAITHWTQNSKILSPSLGGTALMGLLNEKREYTVDLSAPLNGDAYLSNITALKVALGILALYSSARLCALLEAQGLTSSKLNHGNIVQLLDAQVKKALLTFQGGTHGDFLTENNKSGATDLKDLNYASIQAPEEPAKQTETVHQVQNQAEQRQFGQNSRGDGHQQFSPRQRRRGQFFDRQRDHSVINVQSHSRAGSPANSPRGNRGGQSSPAARRIRRY